jgi:hypothetical protein
MEFPDCRNDNYYNANFLDKKGIDFVDGFDWCVEMVVDNFFDNDMFDLLDEETYIGKILSEELPESLQEEYVMEFNFPKFAPRQAEERKCKTYADLIRLKLLAWIEMDRNDLIVSMIDKLSIENEDLATAIRNKVLKDNEKTEYPKEYYDTRKYKWTGNKVCDPVEEDEEE